MASQTLGLIAPLATTLPDPSPKEVLTDAQWTTLLAIAETVVPRASRASQTKEKNSAHMSETEYNALVNNVKATLANPPEESILVEYLGESATTHENFRQELHRTLAQHVRYDAVKGIAFILNTLNTSIGSLVCSGTTVPFHQMSLSDRTTTLHGWSTSYFKTLRQAQRALTQLCVSTWVRTSPSLHRAVGFPRNPVHGKPGKGFDYDFLQVPSGDGPHLLETEVVIVGSGCGAAVAAKNLAEDGHSVLIVDKAYHYPPEYLPMTGLHASQLLFEGGGIQPTNDSSVAVVAGSTWGGGGTVNWSASLQTQGFVRREWADGGLDFFTSGQYQACLDRVCQRMGVSTDHIEHNHSNNVLLEGARRLGYSAKAVPQNTGGAKHYCGYCTLGCGSAEKQGPVVSWLPDAARAGALFMEGYEVQHVIFDERSEDNVAIGVKGLWTSRDRKTTREVIVRAKRVIISAGTIWSPLILRRSGLDNPQIGQNLKLHPASFVFGVWPQEVRPWEGGIVTSLCDEFQNLDGNGHGVKLECIVMLPSLMVPLLPGLGLDLKKVALKFKQMSGFVSVIRDKDSGRVYPDRFGLPKILYTPSLADRAHCMEGLIALAKICYVMGAEEIYVTNGTKPYIRPHRRGQPTTSSNAGDDDDVGVNDADFQSWLAEIKAARLALPGSSFGSAHQMGTCRMGVSKLDSVVGPTGQVWDTERLYVADASVFPSASGVNPMITNMAISDWVSRGIAADLRLEKRQATTG